jgi:hypothetical protein
MPYPVSPPPPPAISVEVHLQQTGDSHHVLSTITPTTDTIASVESNINQEHSETIASAEGLGTSVEIHPLEIHASEIHDAALEVSPANFNATVNPNGSSATVSSSSIVEATSEPAHATNSIEQQDNLEPLENLEPGESVVLPSLGFQTVSSTSEPTQPLLSFIPTAQVPELINTWNVATQTADAPGELLGKSFNELPSQLQFSQLPNQLPSPPLPVEELPPLPPVPVPPAGEILIIPGQTDEPPEVDEPDDPESDRPNGGQLPPVQPAAQDIIELTADRQEYDEVRQVFLAEGNVELRFQEAVLTADRLQVNIPNRIAVADGDATLTRGVQVLRGDRISYNLTLDQGNIQGARGEIFLPSLAEDTGPGLPNDISPGRDINRPLSDRLASEQPLQVFGSPGGIIFGLDTPNQISGLPGTVGEITRLRYEADEIEFEGDRWQATNVRITNDPFSPPELELRSRFVTVTPLSPFQTEIRARNPQLVFDQGFRLPLLRERLVIDNRQRDSGLVTFGFDERDRGGFFIERTFEFDIGRIAFLTLTPQILVQRAIDNEGFFDPSSYGLIVGLNSTPRPGTSLDANLTLTSLDFGTDDFENTYRASVRANQEVFNHNLALEYSYRDRLFNGSLGFQNVQSSLGFVITSPIVQLGDTGISLSYQGGVQAINSDINVARAFGTDPDEELRELLPDPDPVTGIRPNNRIDLTRYQASASLNRSFLLWSGTPLPPTPDQGLRYTPNPVFPFLRLNVGLRGVFSAYSNGDTQSVLTSTIGLSGQFGNFSRPFFDYTGINLSYSYNLVGGETPFNFDRVNDIQVLSLGLVQQIYGPFRLGVRSNIFLESQTERQNNTDTTLSLEYNRRTYSITLNYSPSRDAGSINFRLNDFNWVGDPGPFSGLGGTVSGGMRVPD